MKEMIRVLVVEDHPVTRLGLATVLRSDGVLDVVAEVETIAKAFEVARDRRPQVIVLDLALPDGNALGHIKRLRSFAPDAHLLVITGSGTEEQARVALRDGAHGFLTKEADSAALVRAVHDVAKGKRVVAPSLSTILEEASHRPSLSARELEILGLIVEGFTNAEIGRAFGLSTGTVRTHVSHILEKLDVTDRTEAAAAAIRRGLV
jgi:DNA-binding NarL/FixJ family response regulator